MARQKQATPLRREPSSEYSSKILTEKDALSNDLRANSEPNGKAVTGADASIASTKQAGLPELVICVAGIYGSL